MRVSPRLAALAGSGFAETRAAALGLTVAFGLAVSGCSNAPVGHEPTDGEREARASKDIEQHPEDPWSWYTRGQLEEKRGDLDDAVVDYGQCVALLPERRVTRPALALGRTHAYLGHLEPARRLLEEVVTTVPADSSIYRSNPDFREAALLLKAIYAKVGDARAAARLRERFLGEFGGTAADWPE